MGFQGAGGQAGEANSANTAEVRAQPELVSHETLVAAIQAQRETRHWTIAQHRERWGDDWPRCIALVQIAADNAVDELARRALCGANQKDGLGG